MNSNRFGYDLVFPLKIWMAESANKDGVEDAFKKSGVNAQKGAGGWKALAALRAHMM